MRIVLGLQANFRMVLGWGACTLALTAFSPARDLRITLPKHTEATPVQKLNRDGVKAVQRNDISKAEKLFYNAYLIDPDDPFTLNNLGYISELQGKVDRAEEYYQLAEKESSEAVVADTNVRNVKGRKLREVTSGYGSPELGVNRGNIEAMILLQKGRTSEAEHVLRTALEGDPRNPFTINNLGYVMEEEGELDAALRYYTEAEKSHSSETVVVAFDSRWRGKPITELAAANAEALRKRLSTETGLQAQVDRLNLRGVYAINRNDPAKARDYFEQAYKLDPQNAFALNNRGYIAEMDGDQESANDYYSSAKVAEGASRFVTVTNHLEMKGMRLSDVANTNDEITQTNLEAIQAERRQRPGPIELSRRDDTAVPGSANQAAPPPVTPHALVPRPPADSTPLNNRTDSPEYGPRPPQN